MNIEFDGYRNSLLSKMVGQLLLLMMAILDRIVT